MLPNEPSFEDSKFTPNKNVSEYGSIVKSLETKIFTHPFV